ncbi:MAG: hypothetical protein FWF75_08870, partial [Propionibacteriaceae bacterium]|nr:hypothetical protein [Propionibacteriaceae bacterium]
MTQDSTPRPELAFGQEYEPEFSRGTLSVAAGGVPPAQAPTQVTHAAQLSVSQLADAVQANQRRQLGRAITLVESQRPDDRARAFQLLRELRIRQAAAP